MADQLIEIGSATAQAPGYLLATLHFIAPLRGFEECGHPLAKERAQSLQRMSLSDRAVALATTIASNVRLKREISNRLVELLGIGVDVEFVGSSSVKIFATDEKRGDGQRSFVNEGTGAGQLPFLLVPIALTPKNETVLLAEPEAHLHPKAQYDLARMLLTVAKRENIQFIIETHSEHVLHVILNAVAKGELTPDDVALIYFQNKNGVAEVNRRSVTKSGQVEGGLPDFFEHNLAS
jgi:predicted ATPase